MALSNYQHRELMRDYQKQQLINKRDQDLRVEEIYKKIPQIKELDQKIITVSAARARKQLGNDGVKVEELKKELDNLREEKRNLLISNHYCENYMELQYVCNVCEDTGYVNGKRCKCFEEERRKVLYAQSNIREILMRENFDTFEESYYDDSKNIGNLSMTQKEYMKRVVKRCKQFVEEFSEISGNLLFTGSTGVGKTFLTNCIAKELIERGIAVIYLSSNDLFDILSKYKFSYEVEEVEEIYKNIFDCQLLIIDDLGTEMNNTFVTSQLFYCINERLNRNKGTIISTNLSPDMLRDTYSDRVASRMISSYTTIPLYGDDIRVKKRYR